MEACDYEHLIRVETKEKAVREAAPPARTERDASPLDCVQLGFERLPPHRVLLVLFEARRS
jgi:hypothetical protein